MSNLEYIKQARKILTEDYKTKHTNEYNSWIANHQNAWMQPHIIVPFPPFIVNNALAPFKPSASAPTEEAVIAKALELYNQFNPDPVKNIEPVPSPVVAETIVEEPVVSETIVEEPVPSPVVSETIVEEPVVAETIVEEPVVLETIVEEPVALEPAKTTDAIYKIFQEPIAEEPTYMPATDPLLSTIEAALNIVPQPVEELAKAKTSDGILPSVLQRIQDMKSKWLTSGEKNV
jgi:hypothetical protein